MTPAVIGNVGDAILLLAGVLVVLIMFGRR